MWTTSFPPKHRKIPTYNIHESFWIHGFSWHTSWIHISLEQIRHQNQKPHLHSVWDNPHSWQDFWQDPTSAFIFFSGSITTNPNVRRIYSFKSCFLYVPSRIPPLNSETNSTILVDRKERARSRMETWPRMSQCHQAPPSPPRTHSHQPSTPGCVKLSLMPPGVMCIWYSP